MVKRPLRLLLLQVRMPEDIMAEQELMCVRERLEGQSVELVVRNVFADTLSRSLLDDVDAMVIGGSGSFSVQDPRSKEFVGPLRELISRCVSEQIPGFGICFGHQLLGLHFGADVVTDYDKRESGTVEFRLTEAGKKDPLFGTYGVSFRGHTGHSDYVTSVPTGLVLLAENPTVQTQVFKVDGAPFYSTQCHPDLTAEEAVARYEAFAVSVPSIKESLERDIAAFDLSCHDTTDLLSRFLELVVKE